MKNILVTGHRGFLGRNLCVALRRRGDLNVVGIGSEDSADELADGVARADFIYHLAGVNRPNDELAFTRHNVDLTRRLCSTAESSGRRTPIAFSSSIQADLDNPYGRSKRAAEQALLELARRSGNPVYIFRLPNVFGKWSRPDYNSVVATFCHRISRCQAVHVDDPAKRIRLAYVDDVVRRWINLVDSPGNKMTGLVEHRPTYETTVGLLFEKITAFRDDWTGGIVPDLADPMTRALYATYVSFVDPGELATFLDVRSDDRGWLCELIKTHAAGQVFVSRTRPGVTRGDHFHDSKVEKFCVVQGEGVIRFRPVTGGAVIEYPVDDARIRIVDIPPGLTHSIENTGTTDMIAIFWASEIFDRRRPDTHAEKVLRES